MLSSFKVKVILIRESKIVHKSPILHPLARFVTEEAVSLMFDIKLEHIYVVQCWRYVVYVHGKGLSKFVSYADFPPIVSVKPPTSTESVMWRKRWKKQNKSAQTKHAPKWWGEFFHREFWQASTKHMLCSWGKLVELIKFAFTESTLQELQESYGWLVVGC